MRYLGGKSRLAPKIVPVIVRLARGSSGRYVEPFVGGGAILEKVALTGEFSKLEAGDVVPDLIMLWKAVQMGWVPPTTLPYDEYQKLKHAEPSALRGFAGFSASMFAKWFVGYARDKAGVDESKTVGATSRALVRAGKALPRVRFRCQNYRDWKLEPGDVVYCDPPYKDTAGYGAAVAEEGGEEFDHARFWAWCSEQAHNDVRVIVSEATPPPMEGSGWFRVWWEDHVLMTTNPDHLEAKGLERSDKSMRDALYVPDWLADRCMDERDDFYNTIGLRAASGDD